MFEKVLVVNLDRRQDRWKEFTEQIPPDWPFVPVEREKAIDGKLVKPPNWWTAGNGAWGCYRSHLNILERSMNEGLKSVLILEDDAIFRDQFTQRIQVALSCVPPDWGMIYFGGQHLFQGTNPPDRFNDHWDQPYNVNRTHAYAVRGDMFEILYDHLYSFQDWKRDHHIDHHYGQLHQDGGYAIYSVRPWLIGQRSGWSNIRGGTAKTRFWDGQRAVDGNSSPLVAVVGPFRGGTSCVAGVLFNLGVHIGNAFRPAGKANPKGFFEAQHLASICRQSYQEPGMGEKNTYSERVQKLKTWGDSRRKEAARSGRLAGGKHPTLCLMVPDIKEAWGEVRFVRVVRPLADSIKSLRQLGWRHAPSIQRMIETRDRELSKMDDSIVLDVDYDELCRNTSMVVDSIIEFLDLAVNPNQREQAINFVDPSMANTKKKNKKCC